MSEQLPEPTAERRGTSPVLIVFLIFPVIGLIAAAFMIFNEQGALQATYLPPTPAAITLPPMPTPVNLADAPVIDFGLPTLTGERINMRDYVGQVIFLNFWATWCVPCQREMPTLAQFAADQPPGGALVFAVNVEESQDLVQTFLSERNISGLTVLLDTDGSVSADYGIFQLPVTFVIDGTGVIRYPKYGEITLQELAAYTDALNGERSS